MGNWEKRETREDHSGISYNCNFKKSSGVDFFTKFVCNTRTDNFRVGHVSDIAKELKQKNVGRSKEKFLLLKLVIVIIQ